MFVSDGIPDFVFQKMLPDHEIHENFPAFKKVSSIYFRVKFVGLFVILLAGYSTMTDLWRLLGDHSLSLVSIIMHVLS